MHVCGTVGCFMYTLSNNQIKALSTFIISYRNDLFCVENVQCLPAVLKYSMCDFFKKKSNMQTVAAVENQCSQ